MKSPCDASAGRHGFLPAGIALLAMVASGIGSAAQGADDVTISFDSLKGLKCEASYKCVEANAVLEAEGVEEGEAAVKVTWKSADGNLAEEHRMFQLKPGRFNQLTFRQGYQAQYGYIRFGKGNIKRVTRVVFRANTRGGGQTAEALWDDFRITSGDAGPADKPPGEVVVTEKIKRAAKVSDTPATVSTGDVNRDGEVDWVDCGIAYRERYTKPNKDKRKIFRDSFHYYHPLYLRPSYERLLELVEKIDFATGVWWMKGMTARDFFMQQIFWSRIADHRIGDVEKEKTEYSFTFENGTRLWVDPENQKHWLEENGIRYDGFTPFNNKGVMAIIKQGDFDIVLPVKEMLEIIPSQPDREKLEVSITKEPDGRIRVKGNFSKVPFKVVHY